MAVKRLHAGRLGALAATLLFWLVLVLTLAVGVAVNTAPARAQGGGFVSGGRNDTSPHGRWVGMWNATGVEILDGTVVMIDTLQATSNAQIPIGKGFRTWDGNVSNLCRVVGVVMDNVPGNSWGRVMTRGFHKNVLMAATGYTGYTRLRPSLTVSGALASQAAGDTTYNRVKVPVGLFQRYKDGTTLRGYCFLNFEGLTAEAR